MHIKIIDDKGRITLPLRLRNKLDLEPGGLISLTEKDGGIFINPEKICTKCRTETPGSKVLEAFEILSPAEKDAVIAHLLKGDRGSGNG